MEKTYARVTIITEDGPRVRYFRYDGNSSKIHEYATKHFKGIKSVTIIKHTATAAYAIYMHRAKYINL